MAGGSDDRFREMFYEEARELLIGLEEGLMDLERRQGDRAHLDKTFRAAHSLKGAAAMVGLASLAEFTHGIEAVLDRIRSQAMAVDTDIISTLLEARDHLAAMVESEAAGSPIPASSELTQRLSALLRISGTGGGTPPPARGPAALARHGPTGRPRRRPRVRRPPPPAATLRRRPHEPRGRKGSKAGGSDTAPKARASRKKVPKMGPPPGAGGPPSGSRGSAPPRRPSRLPDHRRPGARYPPAGHQSPGCVRRARASWARPGSRPTSRAVPALDDLDPERCYLSWTITLETAADVGQIREVFLFFTEDSTVSIERRTDDGDWVVVASKTRRRSRRRPRSRPQTCPSPTATVSPPSRNRARARSPRRLPCPPPPRSRPAPTATAPRPAAPAPGPAPRTPPRPNARIRVDAAQLDDLVGLAGELAVLSDNLMALRDLQGATQWLHALESLQRVSREIRDTTLDLRMVPVDELFSRVPRIVRDLADRSGKQIELRIVGQETRLDRTIVERLNDPMLHLIRNAVDHALETPQEREQKGKPRVGTITLSAGHEGDRVAIRVEDDGRGLDREKIVRKGIALGMISPGTAADDPRVVSLIFEPGFSTRETVTELSGRGVGLDVVRDAVRALRGTVTVESTAGQGDGLHLPAAADPRPDRRAAGRDRRRQVRRPAGAGRGMRGAERHAIRPGRGPALHRRPGRAGADGLAPQPLPGRRPATPAPGAPAHPARRPAGRRRRSTGCWAASRP